jgi:DNA-binding MarR family transcriptional regulator
MAEFDISGHMEMASNKFKRCLRYLAEPYLKERDLRMHHILFIYNIGKYPGISQKDLREHLPYDKSRVSMAITELLEMGLVEDRNEGKLAELVLTDKGKVIYFELKIFAQDFRRQLTNGFTDEERAVLLGCFDKFDKNMDAILEDGEKWTV